jgi:hypothetical protein
MTAELDQEEVQFQDPAQELAPATSTPSYHLLLIQTLTLLLEEVSEAAPHVDNDICIIKCISILFITILCILISINNNHQSV